MLGRVCLSASSSSRPALLGFAASFSNWSIRRLTTPPREESEAGRGRTGDRGVEEDLGRLGDRLSLRDLDVDRELVDVLWPMEGSMSESGVEGPRRELMGSDGSTSESMATSRSSSPLTGVRGGDGGGRSGPSSPPTLGTSGSLRRMYSTSSSAARTNCTNEQRLQSSLPRMSVSRSRPFP